ncbi:MAG TPA: nucleotidyltransferase family protein [Hyphomicrobium sp.]|nr:nucleotidyltransferase family protein [Hyphomicrobium sp.]
MNIAAIIVAAGRSSRFESGNKLLAEYEGLPVIRHVTTAVAAAPTSDIVLVIAQDGSAIVDAAGPGRWRTVVNNSAADGLSSSIRCGLHHLSPEIDGVLIVLADMPAITSSLIGELCATFEKHRGSKIVFPRTEDGRQGNPVLWPKAKVPALLQLRGDSGGKALLGAHPELHAAVTVNDDAATFDIDTQSDLKRNRL